MLQVCYMNLSSLGRMVLEKVFSITTIPLTNWLEGLLGKLDDRMTIKMMSIDNAS